MRKPLGAVVLLAAIMLLPGCLLQRTVIGGPHIHDLRFERVALIDLRDRPELTLFPRTEPDPTLLVTFSTSVDIGTFQQLYGYNIFVKAAHCAGRDIDWGRLLWAGWGIADSRGRLTQEYHAPLPDIGRREAQMTLSIVTRERGTGSSADPDGWIVAHDLRRDPVDVCFALRGGAMWGLGRFHSNTATVPATAIRAAFESGGG